MNHKANQLKWKIVCFCFYALFIISGVLCGVSANPEYENGKDLCKRCKCQSRTGVFYLDCTGMQMKNVLSDWPDETTYANITKIVAYFNHNPITHLEPLPATSKELMVSYARNSINELDIGLFTNCVNITSLDLSYNKLKNNVLLSEVFRGEYNEEIYEPIALRYLNLAHNELHTIHKDMFEHLPELRWLDLSGNQFRIVDSPTLQTFKRLQKLEYLNLASNKLLHLNFTSFTSLTHLRTLDLSNNELNFIPVAVKDVRATLTKLSIDSNPIIEITEEDLLGMVVLRELSAANLTIIQEIKTNGFGALKNLTKIDLSHINNKIIVGDRIFNDSLRELNLSNSNLELLPNEMLNWSQLSVLDLRGNQLYCTCDLHSISLQLQDVVKRDHDAPYCFDHRRYKQYNMYTLDEDICFDRRLPEEYGNGSMYSTERILRMVMLTTSVLLIICLFVAAWLGYVRCYKDQRNYPFANTAVLYGPINN